MTKHLAWAALSAVLSTAAAVSLPAQHKAFLKQQVAASETVGFDLYLPNQNRAELESLLASMADSTSPSYHKWLTPADFQTRFGPSASSVQALQASLSRLGLTSTRTSTHLLHITGTATAINQALGTQLRHGVMPSGREAVVAATPINLPASVSSTGALVLGLSGSIRMHPYVHKAAQPANRYSSAGPYWFDDLKQAYKYPAYTSLNGKGTTIGILMSGGFNPADTAAYFGHEKLTPPTVKVVNVLGGAPYDPTSGGTFEAALDIQQTGGMAPKSKIVLYSIPDLTDDSIIAGLAQILADNKADIVSMSFGGPELAYAPSFNGGVDYSPILLAEDDLMAEGNALGITFVASSGDSGALSVPALACFDPDATTGCGTFQASAEFPASSPHVTGVGGTNLATTYQANGITDLTSNYVYEQAFADPLYEDIFYGTPATGGYWGSGGGNSIFFAKPAYQQLVKTGAKVRTVPDLALHMGGCPGGTISCRDDDSSDLLALDGEFYYVIGTSASAPDFAGLTALNVQQSGGRLGNENPYIYFLAAAQFSGFTPFKIFHTEIPGFNGLYTSGNDGYNRVLGNGTLVGKNFLLAPRTPPAGDPQTPSNP